MIEVEAVTFAYPRQREPVLSEFSLSIPPGAFVSLIGRNGSGKSTVARMLNGLLVPQQGRVTMDGRDTRDRTQIWEIRTTVQIVFQDPENQLVASTVEEDIAFGLENLGIARTEMIERIEWALDFTRLRPLRSRLVAGLSGGEKQRVALAGVLAMQPRFLVLDEATAMLDEEGRGELLSLIQELRKETGMTVLQITQRLEEVLDSDRIVVLDEGRIVVEGPPATVLARETGLEEYGLVVPTVVRLGQQLARGGIPLALPSLSLEELVKAVCGSN